MISSPIALLLSAALTLQPIAPAFLPAPHSPLVTRHSPFTWDGDQLIEELNGTGTQLAEYINGPGIDEPLRMQRGTTKTYYLADGLGSITQLTNPQGQIVESYTYDPYGKPTVLDATGTIIPQSAFGNRFLFTGREYDQETGLYDYRNRTLHPGIGGFLQRDPYTWGPNDFRALDLSNVFPALVFTMIKGKPLISSNAIVKQSIIDPGLENVWLSQLYSYSFNNPVNFIDPYGFWGVGVTVGVTGELGAGEGGGTAGTASAGAGVFVSSKGASVGGYTSYGGFASGPSTNSNQQAAGVFGGGGGGIFFTNAKSAKELCKTTSTVSFDVGYILQGSVQISTGDGVVIVSITGGPGAGAGTSTVETQTKGKTVLGGGPQKK